MVNLNLDKTNCHYILIVIKFKELVGVSNLTFITDTGNCIQEQDLHLNINGYVVLTTIQLESSIKNMDNLLSSEEEKLCHQYFYNQTKNGTKDYHFRTTGSVFSFGYGPQYSLSPKTKHSINRFSKK